MRTYTYKRMKCHFKTNNYVIFNAKISTGNVCMHVCVFRFHSQTLSSQFMILLHAEPNHIANRIDILFYVINREIKGRGKCSNEI